MTTSTPTPATPAPQLPSAPTQPLKIVGWLLTYTNDEVDFCAGTAKPQHLAADCDEIAPVVLACDAVVYARTHAARQRALCDDAWDTVETLQRVGACQAAHQRKRIQQLEEEVSRLKQRERTCATMDQAEKMALVRALQECAEALGLGNNPAPADVVKAVTTASDAAYIDETEIIGAELAVMCIEGQDMTHWTDACDVVVTNVLKRLITHSNAKNHFVGTNKKEATHG
jgi:hypothetical protein